MFEFFDPGTTDFRPLLMRVRGVHPDAIFLGAQAQDTGLILIKQVREAGLTQPLFGNEGVGQAVAVHPEAAALCEGFVFGEVSWDTNAPATKRFIERFRERFGGDALPYGIWTAESYDGVRLLADAIGKCGDDVDAVSRCLLELRDYQGVSGKLGIDKNHDGIREYVLKTIRGGKVIELH